MTSFRIPNSVCVSNSISVSYVTASVASWSMTTSSARCFKSEMITVELGTNKVISHILLSFKYRKNGVGAENNICLVVDR